MRTRSAFVAIVGALVLSSSPLSATTCIAGKSFKVRRVCGTLTDKDGAVIPDARIQITPKGHPEGGTDVVSDRGGTFDFRNVANGEYELRVKYSGFWDAWQPFRVKGFDGNRKCKKPIHVVMIPSGGCSYIENAWKKSELKK